MFRKPKFAEKPALDMESDTEPGLGAGKDTLGPEHPSGSHYITAMLSDVKAAKKAVEVVMSTKAKEQETRLHKDATVADVKYFVASIVGAIGIVLTAFITLESRAQDKVDAGVAPVREELREHVKQSDSRFDRLEQSMHRQDLKSDAIIQGLHLYNPAPAPSKDGGR